MENIFCFETMHSGNRQRQASNAHSVLPISTSFSLRQK